jgi:hypothetical protein
MKAGNSKELAALADKFTAADRARKNDGPRNRRVASFQRLQS